MKKVNMKTIENLIEDYWESVEKGETESPTQAFYDFMGVESLIKIYAAEAIKADRAALRKQMVDRQDMQTIDNFPMPEFK